ncbi:MAG TPA: malto-oligosyltrehalose trehalohydrolase [Solirubrobacteraceae bacterium]|jgi:maltooligosyltrehalose trehalohydrolase
MSNAGAPQSAPGEVFPWERTLGAHVLDDDRTEFRVWAPRPGSISLRAGGRDHQLADAGYGVHEAAVDVGGGQDYWFVLDGQEVPDPCSRWQPQGLRGPSRTLDARSLPGRGDGFGAPSPDELLIYELHVGTFTSEGTFAAAAGHLRELAELGITAIEIMPVAEFPGARGWGYDGVYISAAQSSYGGPPALAELVAAAHREGLAVILDVVYNHLGASGVTAMEAYGPYFTAKYETPWGKAINYDDPYCDPVREWVCQSAAGWVRDFGIDGLRLDALHAIFDSSAEHIVAAVARRVHAVNPGAYVIAESGLNDPVVMRPSERGGWNCDAAWADDFHHSLRTLITDDHDGYYADFGRVGQLAKAFHRPHVDDGGYSRFRRRRFGAPAEDVPRERFVVFSQNHDQVGNRAFGDRMPPPARPLAAFCTLLSPFVPQLFMGEEYAEPAPFQFFSDHIDEEIAVATREGRRREFASFAQFSGREIPDPEAIETFERSKLTRRRDPEIADLYAALIAARSRLPGGDADRIDFDEDARWLRVRRGAFELVCNFSSQALELACEAEQLELATGAEADLAAGYLRLPPMSGALIR